MEAYIGELLGTFILILVGHSVNANVSLAKTNGNNSGWIVTTWGWGIAVFIAVFMTADISGAHINPAVTIGLASAGNFEWALVPGYIAAQMIGAFVGALCVWLQFRDHFDETEDPAAKLGVFSTAPAIPNTSINLFCEDYCHLCPGIGRALHRGARRGAGSAGCTACRFAGFWHRYGHGRYHWLCDQSCKGPRAKAGPRCCSNQRQGLKRLGIRLDPGGGTNTRQHHCGCGLSYFAVLGQLNRKLLPKSCPRGNQGVRGSVKRISSCAMPSPSIVTT